MKETRLSVLRCGIPINVLPAARGRRDLGACHRRFDVTANDSAITKITPVSRRITAIIL